MENDSIIGIDMGGTHLRATGFKGQKDSTYRKKAWELMLAGGALFKNLDYPFTVLREYIVVS